MKKRTIIPFNFRFSFITITAIITFILFFLLIGNSYSHQRYTNPLYLIAVPQSSCQINLTWTDMFSNENGFIILRKTHVFGRFKVVHTASPDETSWIDTSVKPGTLYTYYIKPLIPQNRHYFSILYTITPQAPDSLPLGPINLSAIPLSGGCVKLAWSDLSNNEYGFRIERKVPGGEFIVINNTFANTETITDMDNTLDPNTEYVYRVIAVNPVGDSEPSKEVQVKTLNFPGELPAGQIMLVMKNHI